MYLNCEPHPAIIPDTIRRGVVLELTFEVNVREVAGVWLGVPVVPKLHESSLEARRVLKVDCPESSQRNALVN